MTRKLPNSELTVKRRDLMLGMAAGGAGMALGFGPSGVLAQDAGAEIVKSHGYSFFGDLKYPPDFTHFDYVNPDAPKGGELSLSSRGTFDSMNRWAQKGQSGLYSGLVAESMFSRAPFGDAVPADSITDSYCHLAEAVEYPKSKEWCVFHLRPEAKFSDGSQLTAHDAAFTHNLFMEQGIRSYSRSVKQRVSSVEAIDDVTLKGTFVDGVSRRSLISLVGNTPVFSKAWYEETGERLDSPSLLTPLGSGPYVVADFEINRYIVYKRNPDYWGWHLPTNVGRHNFDRVRVEYFLDETAEFEAFKAGEFTFRQEVSTKKWATGYDFPNVEKGNIKREEKITLRLAARVTDVMPNGYLSLAGRQEIMVNNETRFLQVTGLVRTQDISRLNTITYDKIADARIYYGGQGQVTDNIRPRAGNKLISKILPF